MILIINLEQFGIDLYYLLPILCSLFLIYITYRQSRPYDVLIDTYKHKWTKNHSNRFDGNPPCLHPNGWVPVLESGDLKRNQIKAVFCAGKHLAVFRGSSGKCHAFDAYCPHLGANLAIGGTITDETVECPFHGWKFDQTGKCIHVPGIDSPPNVQLRTYEAYEENHFIYVWHHANGEKSDWLPGAAKIFPSTNQYIGRCAHRVNAYLADIMENTSDFQHVNKLHGPPTMLGNLINKPWYFNMAFKLFRMQYEMKSKAGTGKNKQVIYTSSFIRLLVFGYTLMTFAYTGETHGQYILNVVITANGYFKLQMFATHNAIMLGDTDIMHVARVYLNGGFLTRLILGRSIVEALSIQLDRDSFVWSNKAYKHKPVYSNNDKELVSYRKWIDQFKN